MEDERLVCIKIPNPSKEDVYVRVPRTQAKEMMKGNSQITFAPKSAYKKYIKDKIKQEEHERQEKLKRERKLKAKKKPKKVK